MAATAKKRVHFNYAVNAKNVSKADGRYVIRDVVVCVDDLVMNARMYPGEELRKGIKSLDGRPAPAGHPKDSKGRHISVNHGEALSSAYIGAWCTNSRHEGGRSMTDIVINEAQARAMDAGKTLLNKLDEVIAGTAADPVHVSTGVMVREIATNGESPTGKKYKAIATDLDYDHLAILLNGGGAGTPEDGVGMFLNSEGGEDPIEVNNVDDKPVDMRTEGLMVWFKKLLGVNASLSYDEIYSALRAAIPDRTWIMSVWDREVVYADTDDNLYRQAYTIGSDGKAVLAGEAEKVVRQVTYVSATNAMKGDAMKDNIIAALNAAGIQTTGLTDVQLLAHFSDLNRLTLNTKVAELQGELTKVNNQLAELRTNEAHAIAAELAVNVAGGLTLEDLKLLPLERLKALQANAKKPGAAPVGVAPITTNANKGGDDEEAAYATYDMNASIDKVLKG